MAWPGCRESAMFLLLGLLVAPHRIWEVALPAVAVAGLPHAGGAPGGGLAGAAAVPFQPREKGFVAWMGLRGAVPIVLALFPMLQGMPDSGLLFRIAFAVVLASLLLQGTTVPLAARLARAAARYPEPLAARAPAGHPWSRRWR
ncbi:cation:proton antiporter domain-containing protein [Cupriavidus basilensis]